MLPVTLKEERRSNPYVWVTWVSRLLGGGRCEWAAWYRAHFKHAKRGRGDADFLAEWTKTHNAQVAARTAQLRQLGFLVTVEGENDFKLKGSRGSILAGKPDLVAVRDGHAKVVDEKAGKERPSDRWQVLLYMVALPRLWLKGQTISGAVGYRGGRLVEIAPDECDDAIQHAVTTVLQTVTGDQEPPRVPSEGECFRCDVLACPDRIKTTRHTADADDLF